MTKKIKNIAGIKGQRYVHVTKIIDNKYVEFEFAIDDPTINVELVLPFEHFKKFCSDNDVLHMTPEQASLVEYDRLKWRFGVPGFDNVENE